MADLGVKIASSNDLQCYPEQGYAHIRRSPCLAGYLDEIQSEISNIATSMGNPDPFSDDTSVLPNGELRTSFYRALRYLPSLAKLGSCSELTGISKALGMQNPIVMNASNIRMDEGGNNPNSFAWHQDYTYLLGSMNSVTYWIPMQKVSKTLGGIEIVPASHRKGLAEFEATNETVKEKTSNVAPKEIRLVAPPTENIQAVELDRGDLIVFSQFLLHRSLNHLGSRVRWTIQVRHSDASDPTFLRHGSPMGDTNTIFRNPELLAELKERL